MVELTTSPPPADRGVPRVWWLALGVALLLLGLAGAGATTLLELSSQLVFGPLLLAGGFVQLLIGFLSARWGERLLHLASAGVEAGVGFLVLAHPLVVTDLAALVAAVLAANGLLRLARALVAHSPGRGWAALAGAAALALGACVWLKLPVPGLWPVGLCLALDFVCHGASWAAAALAGGKALEDTLP